MPKNRGSILLPILLVSTIALAMALAVASRSLKGLKTTGETEESSTAYSAAEAGIEQALYSIETTGSASDITSPVAVGAGGYIKELTVTQSGGGPNYLVEGAVAKDDVVELKLNGYTGSTLSIYWADSSDSQQVPLPIQNLASLVITYVYGNPPYSIKKAAVNCDTSRSNGFANAGTGITIDIEGQTVQMYCGYNFCVNNSCDAIIPSGAAPQIIRLRPMYNKAGILVQAETGTSLPSQMLTIKSTGQAGKTERTVEVTRSKPSLPAIFDFVLFSGSSSIPLQK
ncbi:MAG: hypothetical protein FJ044_00800 [Candidatus Cloacimonetes bacterium]|nr:hypothetical protein [Candidatus Cloacimonadota bacterium]